MTLKVIRVTNHGFSCGEDLCQANSSFGITCIYLRQNIKNKKKLRNSVYVQKRAAVPKRKTFKY